MSEHAKITDLPDGRKLAVVEGNDALSLMIDVWLCGFVSGGSSAVGAVAPNVPEHVADAVAQQLADGLIADPLAIEAVRQQVVEILTGQDSGPQKVTVDIASNDGDDRP